MSAAGRSLRWLIDKWLTPVPGRPIRLSRFSYSTANELRCIRVESLLATGPLEIFFFRHDDGSWRVFPPAPKRPMMGAYDRAA